MARFYPPNTNRICFPPERPPSPPIQGEGVLITNRTIFPRNPDADTQTCQADDQGSESVLDQSLNLSPITRDILPPRALTPYFPFKSVEDSRRPKPPQPRGPVGKPGSGGYSLPDTLKWDPQSYRDVQNALHRIANAVTLFPFLKLYERAWPAQGFAETYLKNRVNTLSQSP
ncbi:hypothetical protein CC1G_04095 [Coprinopsis cinerea okayama7|uniref:Uncharacterized protein n=1 Tax=Coprinopsis cinerea (strain Okayama-7 / 130 / ATCC MYA-4618 / FGSC 9003) TaxID=240176 RepID=A8NVY7_COPC7|nr:hypothetical protein CC1G_04095 [Coprinopsis cinerea okayama7\|eukprot:XP_001836782.2 hypothetical protein CC1G_04095 [Coprinopsis cinerea okayama7\